MLFLGHKCLDMGGLFLHMLQWLVMRVESPFIFLKDSFLIEELILGF